MRVIVVFLIFAIVGCAQSSHSPHAWTQESAKSLSDIQLCLNTHSGLGTAFENEELKKRKIDCKKIAEAEYVRLLSVAPAPDLCQMNINSPDKHSKKEVKKRGLNCDSVMASYYQQQNLMAQQEMVQQQRRQAQSAALMSLGNQIQQQSYQQQMLNNMNRPVNTNCYRTYSGMNCTSY